MEVSSITMEPDAARAAYEDYAASVKANHDAEDQAIAEGYKALSEGKALINLPQTIAAGGTTDVEVRVWRNDTGKVMVPRLAACRANAKIAHTNGIDRDGGCLITADRHDRDLHHANKVDRFQIADGTFERGDGYSLSRVRAIVPNIPPRLRPKRGLRLYTLLWEAEWAPDPTAPTDPALLRRLGGDLYILLGTWDLSPLEQAVLSGRAA